MGLSPKNRAKPPKNEDDLLAEALAFAFGDELESAETPPPEGAKNAKTCAKAAGWYPDLNPTQRLIFEDPAPFVLGHGEKGSGKSIGFAHKIVRHAYETENALVLIIAPSMRTGNEGIWFDLENLILPQWKEGIGLEYTDSKLDPNTKDRHRWIRNRFGGWSKLLLMSIPYALQVQQRIKGPAPSMVYVDELTNCDGREYFTYPALQLGRRRAGASGVQAVQQYCASCNPDGPSHWVYKVFFVECVDRVTGKQDKDYSVYHVPISENEHRLPEGYVKKLEKILKGDPIELQRLRDGVWVDRPTGEGLFKEFLIPSIHIRGDLVRGTGLRPKPGFPIIIGYDLGQVFSSVTFEQLIPTKEKPIWIIFDEVDHLGQKILYKRLAWEVIERIHFWRKQAGYEFQTMHITDESAINQWRPGGEGSYDAWEFEREYNRVAAGLGGSQKIKLRGCPKGEGSVAARVRLFQAKLFQEELFVSVQCKNTLDMLNFLEADPKDPEGPKRSKYLHKFDSASYPMFKLEVAGQKHPLPSVRVAPSLIRCGTG